VDHVVHTVVVLACKLLAEDRNPESVEESAVGFTKGFVERLGSDGWSASKGRDDATVNDLFLPCRTSGNTFRAEFVHLVGDLFDVADNPLGE
jgi:hypothetical protein